MMQKLTILYYSFNYEIPYIINEWVMKLKSNEPPNDFWNALNCGWWQMQLSDDY
jgi:hypothetical protein